MGTDPVGPQLSDETIALHLDHEEGAVRALAREAQTSRRFLRRLERGGWFQFHLIGDRDGDDGPTWSVVRSATADPWGPTWDHAPPDLHALLDTITGNFTPAPSGDLEGQT